MTHYFTKPMLTVHFFARGVERTSPNNNVTIYCQLEIDGIPRDVPFSTRQKCPAKYWRSSGTVSSAYLLSENINNHLLEIKKVLLDLWQSLPLWYPDVRIDYGHIRKHYDITCNRSNAKKIPQLMTVLDEYVKSLDIQMSTWKTYRTRKENLTKYLISLNRLNIMIDQVKHSFLEGFFTFLIKQAQQSRNVANKHLTMIRAVLKFAVNKEYLRFFPLGDANLKYDAPKPPNYLDKPLRLQLKSVMIPSLEKAKDIAVFLMATGFSYIDYCSLDDSHLIKTEEGSCWKKKRQKSSVYSLPPLFPDANAIIDKYGGIGNLPKPNMDELNKTLKILGDVAGLNMETIGFRLSTSVFRETFAMMCENELMIPARAVQFFMGHKNLRQLNTYSQLMPQRIFKEMEASNKFREVG